MKNKEENRIVSHIISFVLGCISTISAFFWYLSIPTGIISIILGIMSYKKEKKSLGLAGLILGIIGISLCFLIYTTLIILSFLINKSY